MSKKQFTLDSWLKDKSQKVVTRCGFPVRIVCTDVKRKDYPILALVERDDQEEYQSFTKDGRFNLYNPLHDNFDLFIETADEVSEDEKIRKELISFFSDLPDTDTFRGIPPSKVIAWLEKQKEYESTDFEYVWDRTDCGELTSALDKYSEEAIINMCHAWYDKGIELERKSWLEKQGEKDILEDVILDGNEDGLIAATIEYSKKKPKFKIGDFIANDYCFGKVVALTDDAYLLDTEQGVPFSCEHNVHLWTIDDAKDGDVLANDNEIVIFKENNFNQKDLSGCMFVHCSLRSKKGYWYTIGGINPSNYVPATKEQRDLLFHKMKEAGYEWNAEKKELKKINSYCQENCKGFQETGKCFADGECKAKREAEQELTDLEEFINELSKQFPDVSFAKLSRIVVRVAKWAKSNQPKQEWNEEDSYYRNHIIQIIEEINNAPLKRGEDWEAYINWLKSLRPQNNWKPSEEQVKAFEHFIRSIGESGYASPYENDTKLLYSLLEQLKKLKEE